MSATYHDDELDLCELCGEFAEHLGDYLGIDACRTCRGLDVCEDDLCIGLGYCTHGNAL